MRRTSLLLFFIFNFAAYKAQAQTLDETEKEAFFRNKPGIDGATLVPNFRHLKVVFWNGFTGDNRVHFISSLAGKTLEISYSDFRDEFTCWTSMSDAYIYKSKFSSIVFTHGEAEAINLSLPHISKYLVFWKYRVKNRLEVVGHQLQEQDSISFPIARIQFQNSVINSQTRITGIDSIEQITLVGSTFKNRFNLKKATSKFWDVSESIEVDSRWLITGCKFEGPISIEECELPRRVILLDNEFSDTRFKLNLSNNSANLLKRHYGKDEKCELIVSKSNSERLILNSDLFEISFPDTSSYSDKLHVFTNIIAACKSVGMDESANGFDVQLKKFKLKYEWGKFSPVFISFQDYWWGFGYKKSNILLNTVWAFLGAFVIFFVFAKYFFRTYFPEEQMSVSTKKAVYLIEGLPFSRFSKTANRFKISFFYTALVFFGWKIDHSKMHYREHPWLSFWIYFVYTIGIIHLAYLAAFVISK